MFSFRIGDFVEMLYITMLADRVLALQGLSQVCNVEHAYRWEMDICGCVGVNICMAPHRLPTSTGNEKCEEKLTIIGM